jgi:hypothetical protein
VLDLSYREDHIRSKSYPFEGRIERRERNKDDIKNPAKFEASQDQC